MSQIFVEKPLTPSTRLQLVQGDLTEARVDAIVNAANRYLQHGGGLAGAISMRGGFQIQKESDDWIKEHGLVSHAEPAYTSGGKLPCRYVIHTVGPVWGSGDEDAKLAAAVKGSLRLADRLSLHSIAIPAISTGIFGFPKERAAHVILHAIADYFSETPASGLNLVQIVIFDRPTLETFKKYWYASRAEAGIP
jgi:O-acetyl-ADP-ribose deacetylase (regulator of RNase III)